MWLGTEVQPEPIPDHEGIHNFLNRLLARNKHYNLTTRLYQGVTQLSKPSRLTLFKAIRQFPKQNPIEALRRVVQVAPCPAWGETLTAVPVHTEKHVANIEPFHSPGKEGDVFSADRPYVQDLRILPPLKVFGKKAQNIAGVINLCGIRVWVLFRPLG
jgi:hypothetical protein